MVNQYFSQQKKQFRSLLGCKGSAREEFKRNLYKGIIDTFPGHYEYISNKLDDYLDQLKNDTPLEIQLQNELKKDPKLVTIATKVLIATALSALPGGQFLASILSDYLVSLMLGSKFDHQNALRNAAVSQATFHAGKAIGAVDLCPDTKWLNQAVNEGIQGATGAAFAEFAAHWKEERSFDWKRVLSGAATGAAGRMLSGSELTEVRHAIMQGFSAVSCTAIDKLINGEQITLDDVTDAIMAAVVARLAQEAGTKFSDWAFPKPEVDFVRELASGDPDELSELFPEHIPQPADEPPSWPDATRNELSAPDHRPGELPDPQPTDARQASWQDEIRNEPFAQNQQPCGKPDPVLAELIERIKGGTTGTKVPSLGETQARQAGDVQKEEYADHHDQSPAKSSDTAQQKGMPASSPNVSKGLWEHLKSFAVGLGNFVTGGYFAFGQSAPAKEKTKKADENTQAAPKPGPAPEERTDPNIADHICFAEGTLVLISPEEAVAIEKIRPGDLVWSCDPDTKECGQQVTETVYYNLVEAGESLIRLTVDGAEFVSTPDHPYYTPKTRSYIRASELQADDEILSHHLTPAAVDSVTRITAEKNSTVYNLRVRKFNTFFVASPGEPFTGYLVHNCAAAEGAFDGVVNSLAGMADTVMHPAETLQGMASLAGEVFTNPAGVAEAIREEVTRVVNEWPDLSATEKTRKIGELTGELTTMVLSGATAVKAGSALSQLARSKKMEGISKAVRKARDKVLSDSKATPPQLKAPKPDEIKPGVGKPDSVIPKSRIEHYQKGHNFERFKDQAISRPTESSEAYLKNNGFFKKGSSAVFVGT